MKQLQYALSFHNTLKAGKMDYESMENTSYYLQCAGVSLTENKSLS